MDHHSRASLGGDPTVRDVVAKEPDDVVQERSERLHLDAIRAKRRALGLTGRSIAEILAELRIALSVIRRNNASEASRSGRKPDA